MDRFLAPFLGPADRLCRFGREFGGKSGLFPAAFSLVSLFSALFQPFFQALLKDCVRPHRAWANPPLLPLRTRLPRAHFLSPIALDPTAVLASRQLGRKLQTVETANCELQVAPMQSDLHTASPLPTGGHIVARRKWEK